MQQAFLSGNKLKHLVKYFAAFLAVLAGLLTVHYPVLPEKVLPLYSVDRTQAINLGEFLSALAFAASIVTVILVWRSQLSYADVAYAVGAQRLLCLGILSLLAAGLGCPLHFAFVCVSTRVARAVSEAQKREITDRFARDTLAKLRDPSVDFREVYRSATEFLEAEQLPQAPVDEALLSVKEPPFGGALIATYATTMLCFKLGLFFVASGLALLPSQRRICLSKHPRQKFDFKRSRSTDVNKVNGEEIGPSPLRTPSILDARVSREPHKKFIHDESKPASQNAHINASSSLGG